MTDMSGMFYECNSIKNIDLSNLNIENVTNMNNMFEGCNSLIKKIIKNMNKPLYI